MKAAAASTRICWVLLAGLALYLGVVFVYQMSLLADTDYVHIGARVLFEYRLITDPEAFAGDYLAAYATAFKRPHLYEWITRAWLAAGGDLILLHRLIPLVCWLSFLAGMVFMARHFGDHVTVIGALALTLAQPRYLLQMTSAVPHAFAFPLMAWTLVALLRGSTGGLALITVAAGLLYPALAPMTGLLLAWQLLVARPLWRERSPRRVTGAVLLAATGALSLWLVLDAISAPAGFGPALAPGEKVDLYPENSPEGIFAANLTSPVTYVASSAADQFNPVFGRYRAFFFSFYFCIGVYGIFALPREGAARKAVIALIVCVAAICLVILALRPHFLYRFLFYPVYTLLPPLFVVGLRQLCRKFERTLRAPDLAAVSLLGLFVLALDSFDAEKIGYPWHLEPEDRQVMSFAAEQPPGTLFAAFPGGNNNFEWLPYRARRPLLVTLYLHEPRYESHILEMRARMQALIAAYFATDPAPLRALHCTWDVDYLIVEKAHFAADAGPPWYFPPFSAQIETIWHDTPREDFLLRNPDPTRVALQTESYSILDLAVPCETQ